MADREILDIDAFRALYPWPKHMLERGNPLEALWYFDLRADRETLWSHLADTSRFNRALGMPEMKFEERDGVVHGASRNAGIRQVWIEEPWDWVAGQSLQNVRVYRRGLAHFGRGIYRLEPLDDDTVRYYVYFGWIPRNRLGTWILRIGIPYLGKGFARVLDQLVAELERARGARPLTVERNADAMSEVARSRLAAIRDQLLEVSRARFRPDRRSSSSADSSSADSSSADASSVDSSSADSSETLDAVVDQLVEYVTTGDELDLYRIQVRLLATRWGVDEHDLLGVCLHATRLGLLTMSWDVICPHCRGVREEARHLGDVPKLGTCEVCDIDFSSDKENSIEITFHVHPSIRDIPKRLFCSAEPASKLHIRVQRRLEPGASMAIDSCLGPGRYRARLRGRDDFRYLDVKADGDVEPILWHASDAGDRTAGPDVSLVLINDTDEPQTFVIEKAHWADTALRPADLFNVQEFRDLFSEEYLSAEVQLDVGEQTILFTDMVGSTRFYATRGDPEAFVEIKKHFTEVYDIVARHNGAVVKTIGDAVMAAFRTPLDAVEASHDIHECFHEHRDDTPIRLRISLNTGPCIAVNFQSTIDYFGGTVNLAAKLQACAEAGEVAMAPGVVCGAGVREYLAAQGAVLGQQSFTPRALGEAIAVTRWNVYASSVAERDSA